MKTLKTMLVICVIGAAVSMFFAVHAPGRNKFSFIISALSFAVTGASISLQIKTKNL